MAINVRIVVCLTLLTALTGCVGPRSQLNGFVTAPPTAQAQVDAGHYVPETMAQFAIVWNKRIHNGVYPQFPNAMKLAQDYGIDCQVELEPQLAGLGQSAVEGGMMYGAGGAATGAGAGVAFGWATAGLYSEYAIIADAGEGMVNGAVTGSYAKDAAISACVEDFWEDSQKMNPDMNGLHLVPVYAGKNGSGWTPPDLSQPDHLENPMAMPADLSYPGQ